MGQRTLDGRDLSALRERYRRLVETELPAAAGPDWPVTEDHCFARLVLDNVFEGVWDDHVDGRPAYRHLSATELDRAVALAERLLAGGRPAVDRLQANSLRWRADRE